MLDVKIPKTKRDQINGYTRIKPIDLKILRPALIKLQAGICPLCERELRYVKPQQRCVDHDHSQSGPSAGAIRGVLCSNCNGNEGRIRRRVLCAKGHLSERAWLQNLLTYWEVHSTNQTGLLHHTYKTADEKRLAKNAKARRQRRKARK